MRGTNFFIIFGLLILSSGCTSTSVPAQTDNTIPAQTDPSQTNIKQNTEMAAVVAIHSNSSCIPKQEISEYGDVTEYHEIQFTGSAAGPPGSRLSVFLIAGGGVPNSNALLCNAWKYTGANSCTSELPEPALWSFTWKDYSPNTKQYSIRATISLGESKTSTAYCP